MMIYLHFWTEDCEIYWVLLPLIKEFYFSYDMDNRKYGSASFNIEVKMCITYFTFMPFSWHYMILIWIDWTWRWMYCRELHWIAFLVNTMTSQNMQYRSFILSHFYIQTPMVYYCGTNQCKSHRSKAKKLHIMHGWRGVGKVSERSLCTEKALIQYDGGGQNGEQCWRAGLHTKLQIIAPSYHKGEISPDGYISGDAVYFA